MGRDKSQPIRAVIVDDSPTARDLLTTILSGAGIRVVGAGANGQEAIGLVGRLRPDVVTMDVHMPRMDGLEATRRIMRETPTPIVIVAGSVMRADMDLTFEALRAGALSVVGKPGLNDQETCERVIQAVRLMSDVPVIHHWGHKSADTPQPSPAPALATGAKSRRPVEIVGIASSTGGPGALAAVLGPLPADFGLPILVVQHVTPGFGAGFAEWLGSQIRLRVELAEHGQVPRPGAVLIAPDEYHLRVSRKRDVELCKEPPFKGLRPSANYMFFSLAEVYGTRALGIMLTGMGDDGADGMEALHQAGGLTIAQDQASCVVYGMPEVVVSRNAADYVLGLGQIPVLMQQAALRASRAGGDD